MNKLITGQCQDHLIEHNGRLVHKDILADLISLQKSASLAGFEIYLISSYRSFERQLAIWNAKASGERDVLDNDGNPIYINSLSPIELIHSIMRWSALPGSSRHHWGTDIDVIDFNKKPNDYEVQLTPEESLGMFGEFHKWLDERIKTNTSFGFFRPYEFDLTGVAPEKWHLSHAPTSNTLDDILSVNILKSVISESDIILKEAILENLDEIFKRYSKITPAPF